MLLRTKLHGKTHELLEIGGLDTPRLARGYSTTDIAKGLEDSFVFPSFHFVSFVSEAK